MNRTATLCLATLGALLPALGGIGLASVLAAPVGVVRIVGDLSAAERTEVEAAVGGALGAQRWGVATRVAHTVDGLAWVREVRVRRQWPDLLRVAVQRETIAAQWGDGRWLTASGHVVATPGGETPGVAWQPPPNLPRLDAAFADGPEAMRVFGLVNEAAADGGLAVARLEEDAAGQWIATLRGDRPLTVVLGGEHLAARMQRFAGVYRRALRYAGDIAQADARYDRGVAVRMVGEAERRAGPGDLLAMAPGAD